MTRLPAMPGSVSLSACGGRRADRLIVNPDFVDCGRAGFKKMRRQVCDLDAATQSRAWPGRLKAKPSFTSRRRDLTNRQLVIESGKGMRLSILVRDSIWFRYRYFLVGARRK